MYATMVYKDKRLLELNNKLLETDKVIMDLQETIHEKDEVIRGRDKAIKVGYHVFTMSRISCASDARPRPLCTQKSHNIFEKKSQRYFQE